MLRPARHQRAHRQCAPAQRALASKLILTHASCWFKRHDAARAFFRPSPQPRKVKKKETTIKMDFSFVGERAPFLQRQRKMMARDAVARAPPCRTRSGNKQELRADVP